MRYPASSRQRRWLPAGSPPQLPRSCLESLPEADHPRTRKYTPASDQRPTRCKQPEQRNTGRATPRSRCGTVSACPGTIQLPCLLQSAFSTKRTLASLTANQIRIYVAATGASAVTRSTREPLAPPRRLQACRHFAAVTRVSVARFWGRPASSDFRKSRLAAHRLLLQLPLSQRSRRRATPAQDRAARGRRKPGSQRAPQSHRRRPIRSTPRCCRRALPRSCRWRRREVPCSPVSNEGDGACRTSHTTPPPAYGRREARGPVPARGYLAPDPVRQHPVPGGRLVHRGALI